MARCCLEKYVILCFWVNCLYKWNNSKIKYYSTFSTKTEKERKKERKIEAICTVCSNTTVCVVIEDIVFLL